MAAFITADIRISPVRSTALALLAHLSAFHRRQWCKPLIEIASFKVDTAAVWQIGSNERQHTMAWIHSPNKVENAVQKMYHLSHFHSMLGASLAPVFNPQFMNNRLWNEYSIRNKRPINRISVVHRDIYGCFLQWYDCSGFNINNCSGFNIIRLDCISIL